jgi:hypothetical protein
MGLHCVHVPTATKFDYFKQDQPSSMFPPAGDSASNASDKRPTSGYYSNLLWFIFCIMFLFNRRLNLNTCTYNMITRSLDFIIIKILILEIKIYFYIWILAKTI